MIRLSQFRVRRMEPELPGKRTLLHPVHGNDQHKRLKRAGRKSARVLTLIRGAAAFTPAPLGPWRTLVSSDEFLQLQRAILKQMGARRLNFQEGVRPFCPSPPRPASSPQHAHGSARCLQPQGDWPRREGADWFRGAQPGEGWEQDMLHSRISRP